MPRNIVNRMPMPASSVISHRNTFDYGRSAASRNNPLFEFLKVYIIHSDISCKPSSSETYASHSK